MITTTQIEHYRDLILPVLHRYNIKRAAIFGSVAKNKMTESSDLDVLIEVEKNKNFTLFTFLRLEDELSELIDRKVDLVEFEAIKASIKTEVLATAITIL